MSKQQPPPGYYQQGPPPPPMYTPQGGQGGGQGYPRQAPNPQYQPGSVAIQGGAQFDAGARFDGKNPPNIPPPPPGCAPNAAQVAVAQGQSVVMTQEKEGVWTDNGKGGSVWY